AGVFRAAGAAHDHRAALPGGEPHGTVRRLLYRGRRRSLGPGRRGASRHQPRADQLRAGAASDAEIGRVPHARQPRGRAQEVRQGEGPPVLPVLETLIVYPPAATRHASASAPGRPYRSIAAIKIAPLQPATSRSGPFFQRPMNLARLVKWSSGNSANGSCSASTTWLSTRRSVTLPSPRQPITRIAGTMAARRVIRRRCHGATRQRVKPSITTCPASVPVMVLLWPLASRATANTTLAVAAPSSGVSVR